MTNSEGSNEKKYESGSYEKTIGSDFDVSYYIPPKGINIDTKVVYFYGGGKDNYAAYLRDNISEDDNIFLVSFGETNDDIISANRDCIDQFTSEVFESYNLEAPDLVSAAGWSAGAKVATINTANYIKTHPDCLPQTIYCFDWGSNMVKTSGTYNDFTIATHKDVIDTLVENNATLVLFEPEFHSYESTKEETIPDENISKVQINDTEDQLYIPTSAIDISTETDLKIVICTYPNAQDYGINHMNGIKSFNGHLRKILSGQTLVEEDTYNWYKLENGIVYEMTPKEFIKFAYTYTPKNFMQNSKSTDTSGSTVSADFKFIDGYMTQLQKMITESAIINTGKIEDPNNGSAVFNAANNAFNSYSKLSSSFLQALAGTAYNILQISDVLFNTDMKLAEQATMLNTSMGEIEELDFSFVGNFFSNTLDPLNTNYLSNTNSGIKLTKESLFNALSSNNIILSTLMQDINDTKNIKQTLDNFISDSNGKLQGEAWNIILKKTTEYSNICEQKNNYANSLIDGMIEAYQQLLTFFDEYDELDTSYISQIEASIKDITAQIESLNSYYDSLVAENGKVYTNEDDPSLNYTVNNNDAIASTRDLISSCKEILADLKRVFYKLKLLPIIDVKAAKSITSPMVSSLYIYERINNNK